MKIDENMWSEVLSETSRKLALLDIQYKTWLEPLKLERVEDNTLYISTNNEKDISIIEKTYCPTIKEVLKDNTGEDFEIYIDYYKKYNENPSNATANTINHKYLEANLNTKYTFERFVVGKNNHLAFNAAKAVAENPGNVYNPFFIYGGAGLGKTHLMQSIAHYVIDNYPDKKVLYITSEFFTNELINAIGNSQNGDVKPINTFREKYRNIDVLLIDDIQFISKREATQEEFFHTFNTLYTNKKQIVISSDKNPKKIETLEERFKSRFMEGLITDILPPDYETRVAILNKKLEQEDYYISEDIIHYIAENITSNIRELEGSLTKIIACSKIENKKITYEYAKDILKDFIEPSNTVKEITPQFIISVVAEYFHIKTDDIVGKSRKAEHVNPRHITMYLCRDMIKDIKYETIGESIGNKDHSTVVSACQKIEKMIEEESSSQDKNDQPTINTIETLKKLISERRSS